MQGSIIDFTKDVGDIQVYTKFKPMPYDKEELEKKRKIKSAFESKRQEIFRRPRLAKSA